MATANTTKKENDNLWEQKCTVVVPRLPGVKEQPDFVCTLNFKSYQIRRGVKVEVPLPIAEIVEQSIDADILAEDYYFASAQIKGN